MIAVLFEAQALPEAQQRYFELAAALKPLLADAPGFIDLERFQSLTAPERILSLSWWESEAAVRAYRLIRNPGAKRVARVLTGASGATTWAAMPVRRY
ncbi:antibiotic biosynthesis monooxygenase family protein [Cronobacter sakazakii]|uniref:antibiotic biosynthesis monooxygenase family protein n=1 Tax=Cronobacter sakazakii TaxID=28141 RepID=UPI002895E072|nr:antibiotic biosynthesis monooxygenase family protein [Cronobacter sakazakii]MDT3544657.1 antibiotic biosynthesis monooxygenase family protein [Cronobacter sakazakii]